MMQAFFIAIQVAVGAFAVYLIVLGIAAAVGAGRRPAWTARSVSAPVTRFAVLVPAHNEELYIGRLLDSISASRYPRELVDVFVVADNCTDGTEAVARERAVTCLLRDDPGNPGKGQALDWVTDKVLDSSAGYDAIVVFDADSVVDAGFLLAMNRELGRRRQCLQGYYGIENGEQSWLTAVSALAFSLQQYVKPMGRMTLGLSTRLLGNGMCFPVEVLRAHRWNAWSSSEDLEYYMTLLLAGEHVRFVPDAVVHAQMPATTEAAGVQRVRWEKGRFMAVRRYFGRLVRGWLQTRDPSLLDAALDLASLPFSSFALLIAAVVATGLFVPAAAPYFNPLLWAVLCLGIVAYVGIGAALARVPLALVAKSIAFAPLFALWKLWILAVAFAGMNDDTWTRTPR